VKKTILIIDSDLRVRNNLKSLLTSQYKILTAWDDKVALGLLRATGPDLVITERTIPGRKQGDIVRKILVTRPVPVIVIDAHATIEHAVAMMQLGAKNYIKKPFLSNVIMLAIKKALTE